MKVLKDVNVKLDLNNDEVDVALTVAAAEIKADSTSNIFVGIARHPDSKLVAFSSPCFLSFTVCELGPGGQVTASY